MKGRKWERKIVAIWLTLNRHSKSASSLFTLEKELLTLFQPIVSCTLFIHLRIICPAQQVINRTVEVVGDFGEIEG